MYHQLPTIKFRIIIPRRYSQACLRCHKSTSSVSAVVFALQLLLDHRWILQSKAAHKGAD
ncbi:hypothetical protein JZ751_014290 [Albula glossodonta]|uniref:Uncharacterized protein n=1 Tax=Albula glossodonta TaxID=121402 RepID=A0A8T2NSY0_9TELE|nr:hypothetical protein JZ751_014290 [Albula glossodonta]